MRLTSLVLDKPTIRQTDRRLAQSETASCEPREPRNGQRGLIGKRCKDCKDCKHPTQLPGCDNHIPPSQSLVIDV